MANYVTFEQAKWLKEKEFHVPTLSFYVIEDEDDAYGELGELIQNPDDNFPTLDDNTLFDTLASAPEQHQVVEWLRVNHGVFIGVELIDNTKEFYYQPTIWTMKDREYHDEDMIDQAKRICKWKEWQFNLPQEAYSAAFDHIRNNNLI